MSFLQDALGLGANRNRVTGEFGEDFGLDPLLSAALQVAAAAVRAENPPLTTAAGPVDPVVLAFQTAYNTAGMTPPLAKLDGVFGPKTQAALSSVALGSAPAVLPTPPVSPAATVPALMQSAPAVISNALSSATPATSTVNSAALQAAALVLYTTPPAVPVVFDARVQAFQKLWNASGRKKLKVDGKWGDNTAAAVSQSGASFPAGAAAGATSPATLPAPPGAQTAPPGPVKPPPPKKKGPWDMSGPTFKERLPAAVGGMAVVGGLLWWLTRSPSSGAVTVRRPVPRRS